MGPAPVGAKRRRKHKELSHEELVALKAERLKQFEGLVSQPATLQWQWISQVRPDSITPTWARCTAKPASAPSLRWQHWLGKAEWPHLQKVALWWGEVQLSSIDAERAIALVRVIAVPNRGGQSWGAFKRELAFRMHADDIDALLIQNMQRM